MNNLLDSVDLNVELNGDMFDLTARAIVVPRPSLDLTLELVSIEDENVNESCAKANYNLDATRTIYDWS